MVCGTRDEMNCHLLGEEKENRGIVEKEYEGIDLNIVADCTAFDSGLHEKAWFWLFVIILPIVLCLYVLYKRKFGKNKAAVANKKPAA